MKSGRTILVFGTFDLLHPGHAFFLRFAKDQGDRLTVVIGRDSTVQRLKGRSSVHNENERKEALEALRIADEVVLGDQHDHLRVIRESRPDIIVLGYDQTHFTDRLRADLDSLGLEETEIIRAPSHEPERWKSSKLREKGSIPSGDQFHRSGACPERERREHLPLRSRGEKTTPLREEDLGSSNELSKHPSLSSREREGGRRPDGKGVPKKNASRIQKNARELRKNMTEAEKRLWSGLRKKRALDVQWYRQKVMGAYIADFYCPRYKLVVEVDGTQHSDVKLEYDLERTKYLEERGMKVLRFWNSEVLANIEAVLDAIWEAVETRGQS